LIIDQNLQNSFLHTMNLFLTVLTIVLLILKHYNTKAYKNKLLSYQKALESSGLFGTLDTKLHITYLNEKFKKISKTDRSDSLVTLFELFPDTANGQNMAEGIKKSIKEKNYWNGIMEIESSKRIHTLSGSIYPFYLSKKESEGYIIFAIDISEHIEMERKFKEQIYTDQLTNLPNRLRLLEDLDKRVQDKSSMILINIDSFGMINEYFGIEAGDCLLKQITIWLKKRLPTKDSKVYKLDSNIFGIFINSKLSYTELKDYLKLLNSSIHREKFHFKEEEISITFTLGAALNTDMIFKHSYQVLKNAKDAKIPYAIFTFDPLMDIKSERNIKISRYIKEAIEQKMIIPHFQPIQNVKTKEIEKFESLMRIKCKDNTVKSPNEFIPIAVKTKLYPRLTRIMVKNCFEYFHHTFCEFSVNISTKDIINKKTSYYIIDQMLKYDIGPWVVFELLESEDIKNYTEVYEFIDKVKSLGARIAIDDFGTGYSNFDHILKLQVDYIKIDGSLIKNIDINHDAEVIVQTIVSFSKDLGIKTIAEFVSNRSIYAKIIELGVDYAQGNYIGSAKDKIDSHILKGKSYARGEKEATFTDS